MDFQRYSRQTMLDEIGMEGQKRLSGSRVLIVGVGGLGSCVSTYLAGAGIGTLILADPDVVSLSNLQRQVLYCENEVDRPKVECARQRLLSLNSEITIHIEAEGITPENADRLISNCDLVIDCTDNFRTRYLIDDTCASLHKPWIYGSIGEFCGQLSVFNHTLGRRYTELYPDRSHLCSLKPKVNGVIGPLPGVIGSLEANEAIKLLSGYGTTLEGRLFTIDTLSLQTMIIDF